MTRPTLEDLVVALHDETDDVCTGPELMARLPARPRRRRAGVVAVAAGVAAAVVVTVVLAVRNAPDQQPAASPGSPTSNIASKGSRPFIRIALHSEVPAFITIPSDWSSSRFQGEPATIVFPLLYVSNEKLPPQCVDTAQASCAAPTWFPASWRTPPKGVLIVWSEYENPTLSGHSLKYVAGRRTTIDHRPAKISRTAPNGQSCPPDTSSQLAAFVAGPGPGALRFDVTACFGPQAPPRVRSNVVAMLRSLDVTS